MDRKISFEDDPIRNCKQSVNRVIFELRLFYTLEDFPYELEIEGKPATKDPLDTNPRYALHGLHPKEGFDVIDQDYDKLYKFFELLGYTGMKTFTGKPIKFRRDKTKSQHYWPIYSIYDVHSRGDEHEAKILLISQDKTLAYFHALDTYKEYLTK
ncbi:MAG: hypothetical protein HUU54_12825 [Ignavibacteriaceae bacterium]|nr:hypothetical protein [Ignavibacteriaceae bacterium]